MHALCITLSLARSIFVLMFGVSSLKLLNIQTRLKDGAQIQPSRSAVLDGSPCTLKYCNQYEYCPVILSFSPKYIPISTTTTYWNRKRNEITQKMLVHLYPLETLQSLVRGVFRGLKYSCFFHETICFICVLNFRTILRNEHKAQNLSVYFFQKVYTTFFKT